jgi:cytidine deaminase
MQEHDLTALVDAARRVARHAYAPASGFGVGAALQAEDGRVFLGCNVENASYGLTICAERNAVGRAVAAGAQRFVRCVIYTPLQDPGYPCGACRQVLAEFGADMEIVLAGDGDVVHLMRLDEILPHPFRFD